jgi:hypothetical protein
MFGVGVIYNIQLLNEGAISVNKKRKFGTDSITKLARGFGLIYRDDDQLAIINL